MSTTTTDLAYLTITEAAAGLRRKDYSPVDLAQACLDRIEALDPKVNAFITVTGDLALEQARAAERELAAGQDRGPLHGIPFALKDLYSTKGIRTTAHSAVLKEWVPEQDATVVAMLQKAGITLLGKLSMHEFAFGGPAADTPFPPARNPWNTGHIPGGSSSGSGAALAAGLCLGSLGSDTGGSIRGPASHCAIAGLKPTYGLASRSGVVPLSWSLDHVGPMARSVEDCAIILQVIAGHDPSDPASAQVSIPDYRAGITGGVRGLRVGVPRRNWFDEGDGTDAEVLAAVEAAVQVLAKLGATVTEIDGAPFAAARKANTTILVAEAYTYHEQTLQTRPDLFGKSVRNRVLEGGFLTAADYINAQRARAVVNAKIRANFDSVDLFMMPTMNRPAATFDGYDPVADRIPSYTNPFNLTGLPSISVPCGFTRSGLPIGLQLAGRPFDEPTVLRAAYAYEQATDWHTRRPDLGS